LAENGLEAFEQKIEFGVNTRWRLARRRVEADP
jgi:hypothetical protein